VCSITLAFHGNSSGNVLVIILKWSFHS